MRRECNGLDIVEESVKRSALVRVKLHNLFNGPRTKAETISRGVPHG